MIFHVVMLAHQQNVQIYPISVEVPEEESVLNFNSELSKKTLNRIFHNGNADNRPYANLFCSISVGDIVLLGSQRWLCANTGWKKLSVEQMFEYCNLNQRDRFLSELLN